MEGRAFADALLSDLDYRVSATSSAEQALELSKTRASDLF